MGEDAFGDCPLLKKVHLRDVDAWCGVDFGNGDSNPLHGGGSMYLYGKSDPEANLTIHKRICVIKQFAFVNCKSLKTVTIEGGGDRKFIGAKAFAGCSALKEVIISSSVDGIADDAFSGCNGLTVSYSGTQSEWNEITKGSNLGLKNSPIVKYV